MTYDVLLTKENNKQYKARVLLFPDIVITGGSEIEVLEEVKTAITDLRSSSRIIHLDLPPLIEKTDDPWLQYAGLWADDPDWEIFQQEVDTFRQTIESQIQQDTQ